MTEDHRYDWHVTVEPYAAQLLREERGNVVQDLAQQALEIAGVAWRLPKRLDALVTRVEDGSIAVSTPRLEQRVGRLERTVRRLVAAIVFGGAIVAGAIVHGGDPVLGSVLMIGSVVPLAFTVFTGRRGG